MKINPDFKKIAIKAAREGGKIIAENFGKLTKVSYKKDLSLVTKIDSEVEKTVVKLIKKKFPSHNILVEEEGGRLGKGYNWIIDPLDGTTNYISRVPFFSTSISLFFNKTPVLAVVFNPLNKELYFAQRGKGSYLNGERIRIGRERILSESTITFGKGRPKENLIKLHKILRKTIGQYRTFRVFGCTSLELCYVASGRLNGHINIGSKPWDYAAGALIVKEAGGQVTDFKGNEWRIESKNIVASNKKTNKLLLNLL